MTCLFVHKVKSARGKQATHTNRIAKAAWKICNLAVANFYMVYFGDSLLRLCVILKSVSLAYLGVL